MSSYEEVQDLGTNTVTSSGGTTTFNRAEVGDKEAISFVIIGEDANSKDIDVDYKGAESSGSGLGDLQRGIQTGNNFKRTGLDLTTKDNNKIILFNIDVRGLNQVAPEITNQAASNASITVKAAVSNIP